MKASSRRHSHPHWRRRRVLALVIVIAVSVAFLRLGSWLRRDAAAGPAIARQHTAHVVAHCPAERVVASIREWPVELHRDLFQWEGLFERPIPQEAPASSDLARKAAEALDLQAVIVGHTPRALINGELRQEGDAIAGFRIQHIERRRIIVEKGGVSVELTL